MTTRILMVSLNNMRLAIITFVHFIALFVEAKEGRYCGTWEYGGGKFGPGLIVIATGEKKFAISDELTSNYLEYYHTAFKVKNSGECICVEGATKVAPKEYKEEDEIDLVFKKVVGLYTCDSNKRIEAGLDVYKKEGVVIEPYFEKNKKVFERWLLKKGDILMSVYDYKTSVSTKNKTSLEEAIKKFEKSPNLLLGIVRKEKIDEIRIWNKKVSK